LEAWLGLLPADQPGPQGKRGPRGSARQGGRAGAPDRLKNRSQPRQDTTMASGGLLAPVLPRRRQEAPGGPFLVGEERLFADSTSRAGSGFSFRKFSRPR